jgi:hypothetical protein
LEQPTPELYPILGVKPRTADGRRAVESVLDRHTSGAEFPADWPYSLAWFLELYGSPTEFALREEMVAACAQHMIALGAEGGGAGRLPSIEDVATPLWRCARSPLLVSHLRREIAVLTDRLVRRQRGVGPTRTRVVRLSRPSGGPRWPLSRWSVWVTTGTTALSAER